MCGSPRDVQDSDLLRLCSCVQISGVKTNSLMGCLDPVLLDLAVGACLQCW